VNVSWLDAQDYLEWLSQQTKQRYRLPTEIGWEYASRSGSDSGYFHTPNRLYHDEVGRRPPNRWGIYDMLGNVFEWCDEQDQQKVAAEKSHRVARGGGWHASAFFAATARLPDVGFRCARYFE